MLDFPEPPKSYSSVFLEETDRPLPEKIDPRTRYAMFSTIAKGGKSLIKSCKDLHLSRFICYKTLKPEFAEDEVEQQRLIREARVSAMLQHPNTIPTYELGRDGRGNPYFTMKLVHGYTLRELLNYRERYDLTQLLELVVQVGNALQYAHTHGVAHRDIKPGNILAGPYGEVLLLDWGLAKVWHPAHSEVADANSGLAASIGQAGESGKPGLSGGSWQAGEPDDSEKSGESGKSTQSGESDQAIESQELGTSSFPPIEDLSLTVQGAVQGTAHYMSPEQVHKDPRIDHRTDVYSLGAILYEILCGQTVVTGDKLHEVIESVQNDVPPEPRELAKLPVPRLLNDVAMKCINKNPDDRFQTMEELVRLLQQDWRSELQAFRH